MNFSEMEHSKVIPETIIARPYQVELLNEIKKSNTILYLPTGSGKTYIATMLIKEMGESLNKPLYEGRKWTILVVQSVPLVNQHSNSLKKHLPWNIGAFSGDMNVDFWSSEQWAQILNKCHVMVMTAQIYLNNLLHGYMNINDANIIIFDECHHAVSSHPFSQIMNVYHDTFKQNQCSRPLILGLTATLVNSNSKNVKEDLSKLQKTLDATIKTRYDENIQIFSARPEESIILYDENILDNALTEIVDRLQSFRLKIKMIKTPVKNESIVENQDIYYIESLKQPFNVLANYFLDIEVILKESGVYTAFLATWHYIIEIEKKKKRCNDIEKFMLLCMALSETTIIRKMLYDYMKNKSANIINSSSMLANSSSKLKKFMQIMSNLKRSDSCLVFVDRRTTAKMLHHYIKDYISIHEIENIASDFIVGTGGMLSLDSKEHAYKKQQNNDIIKMFNENIINVLITSEVLEEGVDIQSCNYVIRYDSPKHFPSYVQSKGRARSSGSKFIFMVANLLQFDKVHANYSKMETDIENVIIKNEIDDGGSVEEDDDDNEIFKTELATLTYDIAISIINRYCCYLPQDCFTCLSPEWYIAENNIDHVKKYKYKLLLPINSAIKTPIDGVLCTNKKSAKKSAAFHACIELYNKGVLDDNLLPITLTNKPIFNHSKWFPFWDDKDIEASKVNLKPGTGKMKRIVHIKSPSNLFGSYPQTNKSSYLHVLHCVPKYEELKDSNYETLDKLLKSNKRFGILTSEKLPTISKFPIFLHFGNVDVHVEVNVDKINIIDEFYEKLEQFHTKLFLDVLGMKDFVVRNHENENDSYLIVPIHFSDGVYTVDWDVVSLDKLVENEIPSKEKRKSKHYHEYLEMSYVVTPWYRNISPSQRYVVTNVYHDMTPESSFSSSEYITFEQYFKDKYGIHVINKKQPMMRVQSLKNSKINYLTPRITTGKVEKREFIEILVPEFCIWHEFPSVYWLKALMLPTILYRLSQLLLAEDLLTKVNSKCNIKVPNKLDTLEMDNFCGFNEANKNIILPISDTLKYFKNSHDNLVDEWNSNNVIIDIDRQKNTTLLDIYNYLTFMHGCDSKNNDNTESIKVLPTSLKKLNINSETESKDQDLEKNYSDDETTCKRPKYAIYDLEELEEINKLMKQRMPPSDIKNILKKLNIFKNSDICINIEDILKKALTELNELNFTENEPPVLRTLIKQQLNKKIGPNQSDILKVITPSFANDMFNYERMETYGDSFLKFATSIVLFDVFESENEGVLTDIKMKLVGNRNLAYIGKNLNIGSYLMVNMFDPLDWIPPCFGVPRQIKDILAESGLPSEVLHHLAIPREDQFSGKLSDGTWVSIETELMKYKEMSNANQSIANTNEEDKVVNVGHSRSDIFIHKQSASDKMVADCVESLIGIYVYKSGFEEGFKILHGIGILPQEYISAYKPKPIQNHEAYNHLNYSHILPGYQILENRIGYTFKHKHLLVQALTHPTYQTEVSECYQRLEFLGDAILDFLITTYIIEHCKNKTPGEITDIRSALVNNITFASLSTRIGLHRFLLAQSVQLTEAIDRFYEYQQKNNHTIGQEVLYLIEETDCLAAESVDVPKVLGDLFESLIAAIYLDCGRDLNFVWKICYKFMENEINEFCVNVPKNPIRLLHETKLQPHFSKPPAASMELPKGLKSMIQLDIIVNHKTITIYGFGQNKKEAKIAAAKMALKNMKKFLTS